MGEKGEKEGEEKGGQEVCVCVRERGRERERERGRERERERKREREKERERSGPCTIAGQLIHPTVEASVVVSITHVERTPRGRHGARKAFACNTQH